MIGHNLFLFGEQKGVFPDLLATSGDYLRVWRAAEPETRLECVLNNVSYSSVLSLNYEMCVDIYVLHHTV